MPRKDLLHKDIAGVFLITHLLIAPHIVASHISEIELVVPLIHLASIQIITLHIILAFIVTQEAVALIASRIIRLIVLRTTALLKVLPKILDTVVLIAIFEVGALYTTHQEQEHHLQVAQDLLLLNLN